MRVCDSMANCFCPAAISYHHPSFLALAVLLEVYVATFGHNYLICETVCHDAYSINVFRSEVISILHV